MSTSCTTASRGRRRARARRSSSFATASSSGRSKWFSTVSEIRLHGSATDRSSALRTQRSNSDARRLEFLAPGIAHSLGNSLFTIHGNARTMGLNGQATRQRNAILDAASRAEQVLHVLRLVTRDEVDGVRDQAGVLLKRLVLLCTLRMRERQLALRLAHTSKETPRAVDACRFARAVVDVLAAFCE